MTAQAVPGHIVNLFWRTLLPTAVSSSLLLGCESLEPTSKSISLDELKAAPVGIIVERREFRLETYLWRDFMPISPPDGKPLIGIFWITAVDSQPFPATLRAERAFLVNDDEIWESEFTSEQRPPNPLRKHQLEKVVQDGPKWGPHIFIEVVVELIDGDNRSFLLRAPKQWIYRTD